MAAAQQGNDGDPLGPSKKCSIQSRWTQPHGFTVSPGQKSWRRHDTSKHPTKVAGETGGGTEASAITARTSGGGAGSAGHRGVGQESGSTALQHRATPCSATPWHVYWDHSQMFLSTDYGGGHLG